MKRENKGQIFMPKHFKETRLCLNLSVKQLLARIHKIITMTKSDYYFYTCLTKHLHLNSSNCAFVTDTHNEAVGIYPGITVAKTPKFTSIKRN